MEILMMRVFRFDLTSPYDVSTCVFATQMAVLGFHGLTNGSQAGDNLNIS